ncbi:MAG: maltokinase N-terminal cap-like domain-containing protein [Nostocoides sp.]
MAELHHGATLTPGKVDLITAWIGRQRWYASSTARPVLRRIAAFRFDDPAGRVGIETILLADDSGHTPVLYQVPLTYRDAPLPGGDHALVGVSEHSVLGTRWVYDAPHDPAYAAALLSSVLGDTRASSSQLSNSPETTVIGHRHPRWRHGGTVVESCVMSGEQSNTSIVMAVRLADGGQQSLIGKVFRLIQAGTNPDIEVQGVLASAGCDRVPAAVGHLSWQWPVDEERRASAAGNLTDTGDLAFISEFLTGSEDAWEAATRAVGAGEDFTTQAGEIGRATAAVHATLARALPTAPAQRHTVHLLVHQMRHRQVLAMGEVPALAEYEGAIGAIYDAAERANWPAMQRIHGDFHLAQVLSSPSRGWVLVDFEGEPLRSLAQRREPDQWLRDVAGMLRSFDYAGGAHEQAEPNTSARAWVSACQRAFLDGYAEQSGQDPRSMQPLLRAFEVDKMLYEVVYDARHRPTWLPIPLSAISRALSPSAEHPAKENPQ